LTSAWRHGHRLSRKAIRASEGRNRLRTTNPIESTFATVRLRTKVTKGAGSRQAGLAMAFKLLHAAEARWRRINGHELVPLVRAGAKFIDGKLQERTEVDTENETDLKRGSVAA